MFFSRLFHAIKFWFAMLLTGCMLLFVVVNHETVAISLFPLPYTIEMPKFLLALVCFGAGILVGGIMMGRKLTRALRVSHKSHQRAIALENEMKSRQNEEHALPQ
ncbi:MAG: LapA family protein [Alphaproteobacteria bacterium]|nr:LapA family protein [Alphaproteobacteria bacterium]